MEQLTSSHVGGMVGRVTLSDSHGTSTYVMVWFDGAATVTLVWLIWYKLYGIAQHGMVWWRAGWDAHLDLGQSIDGTLHCSSAAAAAIPT